MALTTQRTSKRWKGLHAVGVLAFLVGLAALIGGAAGESDRAMAFGALTAGAGFLAYLWARLAAWWHHG